MDAIINLIEQESKRIYELAIGFFESARKVISPSNKETKQITKEIKVKGKEVEK